MRGLLALTWVLSISPGQTPGTAVDASAVRIGAPSTVAELDLGKLKGELRQLGWSRDGSVLYVQTADGPEASEKFRHYIVPIAGETISEFVNRKPIPGLMFSWGPLGSGAMAYTDREPGHLMLIDQRQRKQTVSGVKDALLPAWSIDGTRLVWAQVSTKG